MRAEPLSAVGTGRHTPWRSESIHPDLDFVLIRSLFGDIVRKRVGAASAAPASNLLVVSASSAVEVFRSVAYSSRLAAE